MTAETSNARGLVEYEYEVWQGDAWQAGGSTTDYAAAQSEADHYAMIFGQDGPVEVRIYEKRLLSAAPPPAGDADVWLFKGTDGAWHTFLNEQHRLDTIADGRWEVRKFTALSQQPEARVYQCPRCATSMEVDPTAKPEARGVVDDCHCATCTCAPGMTPAVRFDTSPAAQEGAIRDHLIALGWTPPNTAPPPSAPAGVEEVVMAARNAENTIRNCAAAGQIGDGYVQYADDLRDAVQRLAQQPAAVDMPAIWHRLGWAETAVPDDWRVLVREARESIETLWKAQQPAAVDRARFRKAPCYLCGYNGPGYFQPETHPCAALYHAAQHQEPKS